MILEFPPVEVADPENGLLAYGGDLEVASLELAYRSGIFPWPSSPNQPVLWFAPPKRAILEFKNLHVPSRLKRTLRKSNFHFAMNRKFPEVIKSCAGVRNRKDQRGTWITPDIVAAYIEFHKAGFAHSFETYNDKGDLVGAMYGVRINKYFAGESMFFYETNASKFALIEAIAHLRNLGLTWMDVQMLNPLLEMFGAIEIERLEFMHKLSRALGNK